MKDFLSFGIRLLPGDTLKVLNTLQRAFFDFRKTVSGLGKDFSNILDSQEAQRTAKLVGEMEGLYGDISDTFEDIEKKSSKFSDVMTNLRKVILPKAKDVLADSADYMSNISSIGFKIAGTFAKFPLSLAKAALELGVIQDLLQKSFEAFEKLNQESINLQKFYQGSKQFADGLVQTANTLAKDIVGVTTESITSFMKQASTATRGFFNPKDLSEDTVKAINNLAGALGTSFEDAAQKFTEFMTGNSDAVMQLGDQLGRVGIKLSELASASQQAQAGFAGANQRMQNLTELLNSKLKDSNEISKQSITGIQELIQKNIESISTSFITPLYGKLKDIFLNVYNFIRKNETQIRNILENLGRMLVPVLSIAEKLLIGLLETVTKFFSGFKTEGTAVSVFMKVWNTSVDILKNTFIVLYANVSKFVSTLLNSGIIDFGKNLLDFLIDIANLFSNLAFVLINDIQETLTGIVSDTEFWNDILNVLNGTLSNLKPLFSETAEIVKNIFNQLKGVVFSLKDSLKEAGTLSVVMQVISNYSNILRQAFIIINDVLEDIGQTFQSIIKNSGIIEALTDRLEYSNRIATAFTTSILSIFKKISVLLFDTKKGIAGILTPITASISVLIKIFTGLSDVVTEVGRFLYAEIIEPISDFLYNTFGSIFEWINEKISVSGDTMKIIFGAISHFFENMKNNFAGFFRLIKPIFIDPVKSAIEGLKKVWEGLKMMFGGNFWDGLKHIGRSLLDMFVQIIKDLFNNIARAATVFFGRASGMEEGDNVFLLSNKLKQDFIFLGGKVYDVKKDLETLKTLGFSEKEVERIRNEQNVDALFSKYNFLPSELRIKKFQEFSEKFSDRMIEEQIEKWQKELRKKGLSDSEIREKVLLGLKGIYTQIYATLSYDQKEVLSVFKNSTLYKRLLSAGYNLDELDKNDDLQKKIALYYNLVKKFNEDESQLNIEEIANSLSLVKNTVSQAAESTIKKAKDFANVNIDFSKSIGSHYERQTKTLQKISNDTLNDISKLSKQQQDYYYTLKSFYEKMQEMNTVQDENIKQRLRQQLEQMSRNFGDLTSRLSEKDKAELGVVGGKAYFDLLSTVAKSLEETFKQGILIRIEDRTEQKVKVSAISGKRKVSALGAGQK